MERDGADQQRTAEEALRIAALIKGTRFIYRLLFLAVN